MDNSNKNRKNLLVLSLSTFNRRETNIFSYNDNGKELYAENCEYQLEPVPKILEQILNKQNEHIDAFILLCQRGKDSKVEVKRPDNAWDGLSPLAYFKQRFGKEFRWNEDEWNEHFIDIDVDLDAPEDGIAKVINEIRERKEWGLYLDTHGGLRGIQRVLEAVVSVLQIEGIEPIDVFSVETSTKSVISEKDRFKIYKFVSGLNEFHNSGRLGMMEEFLTRSESNDSLLQGIKDASKAIQWGNADRFEKAVDSIRNQFNSNSNIRNGYLEIFREVIKDEYGKLLLDDRSVCDEVEWCFEKKFFQQALILVESKMSMDYKDKNAGIVNGGMLNQNGNIIIPDNSTDIEISLNVLWNAFLYSQRRIIGRNKRAWRRWFIIEDDSITWRRLPTLDPSLSISVKPEQCITRNLRQANLSFDNPFNLSHIRNRPEFVKTVVLHYVIKNIRNSAGHADMFPYAPDSLRAILREYLNVVKQW